MDILDSILNSVKKLLGYEPEYTEFDPDILVHINSAIFTLRQLGIGPNNGFSVTSADDTYSDYIGGTSLDVPAVRDYFYTKTKLRFDPPQSSYLVEQLKDQIKELECRLLYQSDPCDPFDQQMYEFLKGG